MQNTPKLVIAIDEAHSLDDATLTSGFIPSHAMCRAIAHGVTTSEGSTWVVFASTGVIPRTFTPEVIPMCKLFATS